MQTFVLVQIFSNGLLEILSSHNPLPSPSPSPSLSSEFIVQDFAVIMIVAAIMLVLTYKLKQPMVIGYIIAGMIIGPHTPPFSLIHNVDTVNVFAELGIIMLLFVIGTEFPVAKLRSVGKISIIVALAETVGTILISFFIGRALGFSFSDSMFLALGVSITSTVVTVRVLEELDMIKDNSTILLLGISVIEDIIAITALGLFQSISSSSNGEISVIHISISVGIVAAFVGSILILGSRYIPNVIDMVSKTNDYAILLIVILGLAFGLSFAAKGLGLSVVTGAFLAGVLIAESKNAATARVITIPLRDMFAALFFISVGALMEVSLIPLFIVPAVVFILSSFASKFLIITLILSKLSKYANITALRTGLGMASARGELSLIVAKAGQDTGVVSSAVFPILGVVTIITTFITPYILRFGKQLTITSQDSSYFDNSNNNDKY